MGIRPDRLAVERYAAPSRRFEALGWMSPCFLVPVLSPPPRGVRIVVASMRYCGLLRAPTTNPQPPIPNPQSQISNPQPPIPASAIPHNGNKVVNKYY
jgi:hypothetical protein